MPGDIGAWSLVRFLHVLGAVVWVGGQLTRALVVVPVVRRRLAPDELAPLLRSMGERSAWIASVVLLATSLVP